MSREMALAAYRHLLRSTRVAFHGDSNILFAARQQARQNFEANRGLSSGSDELSKQISHAEEVAKFLRENVVQGQAMDTGAESYSTLQDANTRLPVIC
jgi:complex III assembly factor LYRM7